MSGPKYGRYYLTAAQRKRLLEERLKRQQEEALRRERNRIEKLIAAEDNNVELAARQIAKQKTVTIKNIDTALTNVANKLELLLKDANKAKEIEDDSILLVYNQLKQKQEALIAKNSTINENQTLKFLDGNLQEINEFIKEIDKSNEDGKKSLNESQKRLIQKLSVKIEKSIASFSYADYLKANDFNPTSYLNKLETLANEDKLSDSLKESVSGILTHLENIKEIKQLRDYCLGVVSQVISECDNYLQTYDARYQEFINLVEKYENLSLILHEESKHFEFNDKSVVELKELIEQYQCLAENELEKQFIASSFNDVLVEMGYNLLGQKSKVLNKNNFYCSRVYSYENGNVANVVFSSDGQISIEIGMLDNVDREPSNTEINKQIKSMHKLCEDLPIIEEKLKAKGVLLKERIAMQPVDEAFAQIINGNEYNVKVTKEEYIPIEEQLVMYMEDEEWL